MDQGELLRRAQVNALKEAMLESYGKPRQQAVQGWAPKASAINDNIMRATNKMGAMFAKPTGLGEQAAGYMKTVAPSFGSKALGFFANPWLATIAGLLGPSKMDQDRSAEFIGSPEHQQWLARKGPLAKYPE